MYQCKRNSLLKGKSNINLFEKNLLVVSKYLFSLKENCWCRKDSHPLRKNVGNSGVMLSLEGDMLI